MQCVCGVGTVCTKGEGDDVGDGDDGGDGKVDTKCSGVFPSSSFSPTLAPCAQKT